MTGSHLLKIPTSLAVVLRVLWKCAAFLLRVLALLWASFAIHFSNLPWPWLRTALGFVFFGFGVWALWLGRQPRMSRVFAAAFLAVLVWWGAIRPSHDRNWAGDVAVLPRVKVEGDRVRISNFRNFDWHGANDFTARYEEREVQLSHLVSLDFFVSYWKPGPVAHTFLSFNFDNAPPVCISIEVRPEEGRSFEPVATIFKQFHLFYAVGDERDIVRVRTNFRGEEVFRYRIRSTPQLVRQLFLVYIERINALAGEPEFYHLFSNSCTVNIVRYARAVGHSRPWDIRQLLNGYMDRYLYRAGLVETAMPFEQFRESARINAAAIAAGDAPDFSGRIRGTPENSPPAKP